MHAKGDVALPVSQEARGVSVNSEVGGTQRARPHRRHKDSALRIIRQLAVTHCCQDQLADQQSLPTTARRLSLCDEIGAPAITLVRASTRPPHCLTRDMLAVVPRAGRPGPQDARACGCGRVSAQGCAIHPSVSVSTPMAGRCVTATTPLRPATGGPSRLLQASGL